MGAGVNAPCLIIALDVPSSVQALALAQALAGLPLWLKVGLELFTAEGPDLVRVLLKRSFPLFLDLKFHDIPPTVRGAVRAAARLGAHMLTLHLEGGEAMAAAALEGRGEARAGEPPIMGVTVLTSLRETENGLLEDLVLQRALEAKRWGLDGIVCSGREVSSVRKACGPDFLCLCPGIRFEGEPAGADQARVVSPAEAVAAGADFLVMGRPVTRSANPAAAARRALNDMGRRA
ncbi:MAG: orotidine-5'-phosphate decarboxylase [Desulfovibrio sp.]|jgi:orotidine-5'-phosphate decarboxylase|nr:orotidine-5'-phosphate decarboxylase [Desulfovibrio sp.]